MRWSALSPAQILMVSFATIITVGTVLLCLSIASDGDPLSIIDSLFTATSAVCVTGLVVVDTGTKLSPFGQAVVLVLIQLGGLGIMTFSTFFLFLLGRPIPLRDRDVISSTLSHEVNIVRLLKSVLLLTVVIETVGVLTLSLRFIQIYPLSRAFYSAIFHSISAFCNAGFSLYAASFTDQRGDPLVNITLMFLIISGGLGFPVLLDLRRFIKGGGGARSLSFHSKIVLVTTVAFILGGALLFFLLEMSNSLRGLPWDDVALSSFFQSVTPRTAGFNTLDVGALTNSTLFLLVMLMFIGGGSGSCAGGVKISTFGVLAALGYSRFKNHEDVNIFRRRVPAGTVAEAISIVSISSLVVVAFAMLLLITELKGLSHQASGGKFLDVLFEATSAFGTVGLSTGLTPNLTLIGKLLITSLMFIGRLGPLTIVMAVRRRKRAIRFKYAQEDVMVG